MDQIKNSKIDQIAIDKFIADKVDKFHFFHLNKIQDALSSADEDKFKKVLAANYKNPSIVLLVSLCLGSFGIDRLMIGQPLLAALKLLTFGGAGLWAVIDWFRIYNLTKDSNFKLLMDTLS